MIDGTEALHVNEDMVGERFPFPRYPETLPVRVDGLVGLAITFRD
jgi:hypothetical protein